MSEHSRKVLSVYHNIIDMQGQEASFIYQQFD